MQRSEPKVRRTVNIKSIKLCKNKVMLYLYNILGTSFLSETCLPMYDMFINNYLHYQSLHYLGLLYISISISHYYFRSLHADL